MRPRDPKPKKVKAHGRVHGDPTTAPGFRGSTPEERKELREATRAERRAAKAAQLAEREERRNRIPPNRPKRWEKNLKERRAARQR